jgi:hypothetical protein
MDFIERWLHLSPDHGDGTFEWAIVIAVVASALIVVFRKRLRGLWGALLRSRGEHEKH